MDSKDEFLGAIRKGDRSRAKEIAKSVLAFAGGIPENDKLSAAIHGLRDLVALPDQDVSALETASVTPESTKS